MLPCLPLKFARLYRLLEIAILQETRYNFKKKYQIRFADQDRELVALLEEDIEDCERQAANEYFRKQK